MEYRVVIDGESIVIFDDEEGKSAIRALCRQIRDFGNNSYIEFYFPDGQLANLVHNASSGNIKNFLLKLRCGPSNVSDCHNMATSYRNDDPTFGYPNNIPTLDGTQIATFFVVNCKPADGRFYMDCKYIPVKARA